MADWTTRKQKWDGNMLYLRMEQYGAPAHHKVGAKGMHLLDVTANNAAGWVALDATETWDNPHKVGSHRTMITLDKAAARRLWLLIGAAIGETSPVDFENNGDDREQ